MKYLKKFENFDLGRFSEDEQENDFNQIEEIEDDCYDCGDDEEYNEFDEEELEDEENEERRRVWGDELVEGLTAKQKKLPKALQDAILKKKGKKSDDKEDDKNDKKSDKKEEPKKGLTAAQKKLPKALQDAILKKQKKITRYLKSFNESFESGDLMTDEEVKQEVLQRIKDLGETSNQWTSRDTLKEFTNWGFWSGDVMAIIDVEIAEKIASELYEYVEDLKTGSPEIDEVYDLLYR